MAQIDRHRNMVFKNCIDSMALKFLGEIFANILPTIFFDLFKETFMKKTKIGMTLKKIPNWHIFQHVDHNYTRIIFIKKIHTRIIAKFINKKMMSMKRHMLYVYFHVCVIYVIL
jgi:hypothetical protein